MDNVLVDFPTGIAQIPLNIQQEFAGRLDEVPHFFSKMTPIAGAVEAFDDLSTLFDTYILSTAPWENPTAWSDKLDWVKKYIGKNPYKHLILSHHKNLNDGHFLVDDRAKNGVDRFKGLRIHLTTSEFPDWPAVTKFLK